ncbi:tetratricopeptide repeat protein [Desulfobotulus mexicanus]|uniref:Tetratricopeptide repeat protein n=1 Tax=Desulfobotulus mexicanus TaxID=2586642 RepID=A0A5Q4VCH9_9BACT|nr:hypothetical protein [Desulfobotulus mexicanus]TYT75414.1 hypothetical protein FIM25_04840 [Desulfobotulus mexicanus]
MSVKDKFQVILKEARLYSSQGLYDEALTRFESLEKLVEPIAGLKNKEALISDIRQRISELHEKISAASEKNEKRTFTARESKLVNTLLPDTEETPAEMRLEKGRLLARYGSYPAAIALFSAILKDKKFGEDAGHGLITAMVKDKREEEAADLLRQWQASGLFSEKELTRFQSLIPGMTSGMEAAEDSSMDLLPVSSVGIRLENVPEELNDQVDLDVSFQSGNLVSLIISSKDKKLIDDLKVGLRLNDMRCYSPVAVFRSSGVVASKHQINAGPKKGDWCLNIEIKG